MAIRGQPVRYGKVGCILYGYICILSYRVTSSAPSGTPELITAITESKPTEFWIMVVIVPLVCSSVVIILCTWCKSPSVDEETILINRGPIKHVSCQDYRLKAEIDSGGKKKKKSWCGGFCCWCWESKDNFFSSLRLVTVAGDGEMVMLDNDAIQIMSKKYKKKKTFKIWQSVLDEYVAMASSKRKGGEVLVARKKGEILWRDNSDGKEVEIDPSHTKTLGAISDMDVDDMGTIYVADIVNDEVSTFSSEGSFQSSFAVGASPKCISASEDGILYVLSGSKIQRGKEYDIEGGTIKKFRDFTRQDYDIKCPTDLNIVTTGLNSSTTSLYVLTKKAGSEEGARAVLQFSATDGHLTRRIIDDWPGILGIVLIKGDDELAFFDSKEVKVYERKTVK